MSAADRKGPFLTASHTKKGGYSVVLWRVRGICSPCPFSAAVQTLGGAGGSHFCLAQEKQSPESHGPFLSPWPRLFWQGEKIIVVHIQWRNASKSAGSVARIEGAKGCCRREGMNTVTWGAACGGGGLTQAQTRGSVLDPHGPSGRNTVPLPSFLRLFFFYIAFALKCVVSSHVNTLAE